MIWWLYIIVSTFQIISIFLENSTWIHLSKPFLMPILMLVIWSQTHLQSKLSKWLMAGVFMGWLGDLFLMKMNPLFFSLGLSSFLIGHILYIYVFSQEVSMRRKTHFVMEKPYIILPYIAFWIFSIRLLSPHLQDFPAFPIYLYAFVIFLMSIMSINRKYAVSSSSWWTVIVGSLLFIVSDFSLSIKIFIQPFSYSSILIMGTYLIAQAMIVRGCLKDLNTNS